MHILLEPHVAISLEAMAVQTGRLEFSGLGTCHRDGDAIVIDDVRLMDVGNEGYTEAPPKEIYDYLQYVQAQNKQIKVWYHRHPMGNGKPGDHNWSGRDVATIKNEPLGGFPHLVKWSVSIVRTPAGWVGRLDDYINNKTYHLEVLGQAPQEVLDRTYELTARYYAKAKKANAPRMSFFDKVQSTEFVFGPDEMDDLAYEIGSRVKERLELRFKRHAYRRLDDVEMSSKWQLTIDGKVLLKSTELPPRPKKDEIDEMITVDAWREYAAILFEDDMFDDDIGKEEWWRNG